MVVRVASVVNDGGEGESGETRMVRVRKMKVEVPRRDQRRVGVGERMAGVASGCESG